MTLPIKRHDGAQSKERTITATTDPRWVYRPLIDLIGRAEGTDPVSGNPPTARGYNETLSYGRFAGGPVDLVSMTLDQVDALQTRMLAHPENHLNSSAVGRSQFVRTTLRDIRQRLKLSGNALFDEAMQDRLTCFLLGRRGIDSWLADRLTFDALVNNLAQEWASFPTIAGVGHYSGQSSRITVSDVRTAVEQVRERHSRLAGHIDTPAPPKTPVGAPQDIPGTVGDPTLATVMQLAQQTPEQLDRALQMLGLARAVQKGWTVDDGSRLSLSPIASNKDTFAMTTSKNVFASKTIWGLIVTALSIWSPAIGQVLGMFGLSGSDLDAETVQQIVTAVEQVVAALGLAFSAYGRIVAKADLTVPLVQKQS